MHVRAPACVTATLFYTSSTSKLPERAFVKHRRYMALVTSRDVRELRALEDTGLCRDSSNEERTNIVDISVYDPSHGEKSGEMLLVIEFDRPVHASKLTSYFVKGRILPLHDRRAAEKAPGCCMPPCFTHVQLSEL